MAIIIGFSNKKGGVGKTTSCVNIASYTALKGYKTLIIDLDAQGNASLLCGVPQFAKNKGISTLLYNNDDEIENEGNEKINNNDINIIYNRMKQYIMPTMIENLDIIPADNRFNEIETILKKNNQVFLLSEKLMHIETNYEYIMIDFPPSLSLLTLNGFVYCKNIIIPVQTNYLSLNGVKQMTRLIYKINNKLNPSLEILGILPTICDFRTNMHKEVLAELIKTFGKKKVMNPIHSDVKIAEMGKLKKPICLINNSTQGAIDYLESTETIIKILS